MIKVTFINADGDVQEVNGVEGQSLLDVAQAAGQPLEGTCESQMACSTCHVIIDKDWFDKLPRSVEDEEDMLDQAFFVEDNSRLGCQIFMREELDGLTVRLAEESE